MEIIEKYKAVSKEFSYSAPYYYTRWRLTEPNKDWYYIGDYGVIYYNKLWINRKQKSETSEYFILRFRTRDEYGQKSGDAYTHSTDKETFFRYVRRFFKSIIA